VIGQTVSHYKITAEIGAGGMGVVYEAEDLNLKRTVAIKFLPTELTRDAGARKRFITEAQTASSLDHTNVCNIHEVGETDDGRMFIVMTRYTGETLKDRIARGPLPIDEALDIAGQIIAGLSKAHAQGIVHRDIKPGNVFITSDGVAKILDFGLARIAGASRITKTGTTVGTVAYMSPEQAGGGEVDARSDVWSVGAVLYEMLTGKAPFRGDAEPAIVNSILTTEPEPVTTMRREVPVGVEDVVERALVKDPNKRYQTADDLGAAIEEQRDLLKAGVKTGGSASWKRFRRNRRAFYGSLTAAAVVLSAIATFVFYQKSQAIDFIAVMPVEDLTAGADSMTYFADGMTSDLINTLGQVGTINVVSRTTVERYKQTDLTPREIADELGVKALLFATAIRDGKNVRVSAELIDTKKDHPLWAATFDRRLSRILNLYREVARLVAREVHAAISPDAAAFLESEPEIDPAAYEAYLDGKHLFSRGAHDQAQERFEKVLAIDSTFAPAWTGLANTYVMRCHGWPVREGFIEKSRLFAERGLELDPMDAEGYFALGHIAYEHDWDLVEAQRVIDRGLELNPSSAYGHLCNTFYCILMDIHDEAIESARKLVDELDPYNYMAHWALFNALLVSGQLDLAWAQMDRAAEVIPGFERARPFWLRDYYAQKGDWDNWIQEWAKTEPEDPEADRSQYVLMLACSHAIAGNDEQAQELANEWLSLVDTSTVRPLEVAGIYAALGQYDDAFRWLDKAYEQHDVLLVWIRVALHVFSSTPFKDDPRYDDLLRKIGLEE
jgi:serine/threonine protein kinase